MEEEKTNMSIRTDRETKEQAEALFDELGLDMTTAVNMFLKAVVREHGMPFGPGPEPEHETPPNDTTTTAINEGREMMKDASAPRFHDMDALKKALGA